MEFIAHLKNSAVSIYKAARDVPEVFFPIFFVGLVAIWIKWRIVGKGVQRTQKDNFAGWVTDAAQQQRDLQSVLVMKPVKLKRLSLGVLLFFGGGAIFLWFTTLQAPLVATEDWMAFGCAAAFGLLALWMLWFSFTRITVYPDRIERTAPFRRKFMRLLSQVVTTQPISKTAAGGVRITFRDDARLRVAPRMSGYRQLLELLAKDDPKLRLMTNHFSKIARETL